MSDDSESTYAAAPFDHAKADVILRSSDNIDFCVFKLFLSVASPVFETLFDIPQPTEASEDQEIKDGLVVIPLSEDSKTLNTLLRFCYPSTLADDPNLEILAEPFRCFVIARRARLQEETLLAAKYTLSHPLVPSWFEEIGLITAADLLALLTYRKQCGDAVYALRNDISISRKYP